MSDIDTKILGFLGLESYDLLQYVSSVLLKLDCSVLLVDNSKDKSLAYAISQEELEEGEIYDYNGVDFGSNLDSFENLDYDYIFIHFGFNFEHTSLKLCEEYYVVTDLQYHHLVQFNKLNLEKTQSRFLILREWVNGMSEIFALECLTHLEIPKGSVLKLESDYSNLLMKYICQYEANFKLAKVSKDIIDFIFMVLDVDFSEKEISSAIKLVKKSRGAR